MSIAEPDALAAGGAVTAIPGHTMLIGVSTSVLGPEDGLDCLLDIRADVVEWYGLRSSALPEIERFAADHGIRSALHAPLPFDGHGRPRFAPTSADPERVRQALAMVRETLACARALAGIHVVIHFPDPDPPYVADGFESRVTAFLDAVTELSIAYGVRVLLENLTPNPLLNSPDHYRAVLERYEELRLCLDLGHAHLAAHTVDEYVDALADRVDSIHVYNTTPARYAGYGHEPIADEQAASGGYLDWHGAVVRLLRGGSPRTAIVEHDGRYGPEAAGRAVARLRRLVAECAPEELAWRS